MSFMPLLASLAPTLLNMGLGAFSNQRGDKRWQMMDQAAAQWSPEKYQARFGMNLQAMQNSPMFKEMLQRSAAQASKGNAQLGKQFGPRAGTNMGVTYNSNTAPAMGMAWQQAQNQTDAQAQGFQQAAMGYGQLPAMKRDQYIGAGMNSFGNALPYILQNWNKFFPGRLPQNDIGFYGGNPQVPGMRPIGGPSLPPLMPQQPWSPPRR